METDAPDFKDREAFDPNDRELCPDGACTGLVGVDGKCKVCGKAGVAPSGERPVSRQSAIDDSLNDSGSDDDDAERAARAVDRAAAENDDAAGAALDDDRQLCSDGACTGLIGSDGKCKVCGLPAAS